MPQVQEEIVEVAQISPQRIREHIAVEVPQVAIKTNRGTDGGYPFAIKNASSRTQTRIEEQSVDSPIPQITSKIA